MVVGKSKSKGKSAMRDNQLKQAANLTVGQREGEKQRDLD